MLINSTVLLFKWFRFNFKLNFYWSYLVCYKWQSHAFGLLSIFWKSYNFQVGTYTSNDVIPADVSTDHLVILKQFIDIYTILY